MRRERYTAAAILLHWSMAALMLGNVVLGWWMHEAIDVAATQGRAVAAYQLHKSIGLTVLALTLLRLGLRLAYAPPPAPAGTPRWQRHGSLAVHWLFYGLMLGLPLSGWIVVSTQWRADAPLVVPTLWFGLFEVPHLFGLHEASPAQRSAVWQDAIEMHEILAGGMLALLALHVAAALKHHFVDRDGVLLRMSVWGSSDESPARRWGLRAGLLGMVAAAAAIAYPLLFPPAAKAPAAALASITAAPGRDNWGIVPGESYISFAGTHAGTPFEGRFEAWRAAIRIDREEPRRSSVEVVVDTASARDGVKLHDETLPGDEWFDVEDHPTAVFRAANIRPAEDGAYRVDGTLVIKDRSIDVSGLTLAIGDSRATIGGSVTIDRADANLGMESDPGGRWVSREIIVQVLATLVPPPGSA